MSDTRLILISNITTLIAAFGVQYIIGKRKAKDTHQITKKIQNVIGRNNNQTGNAITVSSYLKTINNDINRLDANLKEIHKTVNTISAITQPILQLDKSVSDLNNANRILNSTPDVIIGLTDEIEKLRKRILELERNSR